MRKGGFSALHVVSVASLLLLGANEVVGADNDDLFSALRKVTSSDDDKKQDASPPIRARTDAHPAKKIKATQNPGIENRVNPKKREGKEGSEEAKLDAAQARELYIRRKRRLEELSAQQGDLARDQRILATNRARMRARLLETAHSLRHSERRLSEIEAELTKTRALAEEQKAKLTEKQAQMEALFSLMQGMSRQPPPMIITHSRDALNMIRSGMILATFYSDIENVALQVRTELKRYEDALKLAEKQEQRLKAEQIQNSRLKNQIDQLLIENHEQLEATDTNLKGLKDLVKLQTTQMKSLEDMVPKLDEEVAKQSALGKYEESLKQVSFEVAPDPNKLAVSQPDRLTPAIPFARAQGLLPLPVQGKIAVRFAENDADGFPSKGLYIESRQGAQVVSPCDGWVIFAGQHKSYGQLLIINPGGGYHVILSGMDRVQASVGQFVLSGEPVATMSATEPRTDQKTQAHPKLYVEFRRDKQPIDPSPWWQLGIGKG
jgi:septal ring factor EnvC (AmiA/AmiB activator)